MHTEEGQVNMSGDLQGETLEHLLPHGPQGEPALPTPSLGLQPPDCEMTQFCCVSYSGCGAYYSNTTKPI